MSEEQAEQITVELLRLREIMQKRYALELFNATADGDDFEPRFKSFDKLIDHMVLEIFGTD